MRSTVNLLILEAIPFGEQYLLDISTVISLDGFGNIIMTLIKANALPLI